MAEPGKTLDRPRREALRFARDAKRLATRHRRRLGKAREDIENAASEVESAVAAEDNELLSGALQRLDGLWDEHLAFSRKGLLREYAEAVAVAVAVALLLRGFVVDSFTIPTGSMVPTLVAGDHVFVSKLAYGLRIPFTRLHLLRFGAPRRGDVVVFASPRDRSGEYVKRVVGLPGDVIEIREQVLYVNGVPQPRTPAGDYAYEERSASGGTWSTDTCRLFRESLARGTVARPASELPADVEASWQAAAAAGVGTHAVIQCRRARLSAREGPFEVVKPGHVFVLGDNRDRSADSRGEGGWQVPLEAIRGRATLVWWSFGRGGRGPGSQGGVRLDRLFKPVE
ncbi:MAG TPA: signal peptidase I [Anaeromyxobacteraceae bacterium]|nr:signal peptidase I [Anaeromyxobacteraceae bacterium]